MIMENQIVETQSTVDLIKLAIEGKSDLAQLKELLALKKEYEVNEARKAYHKAMADFKANPPTIEKDRAVSFLQTKFNYATLANVTKKIGAALSTHGLSASWSTKQNGMISVTCRITHVLGHSEETTLSADADKTGSKNSIQALGSTISYLERYTLLALAGLATEDMDDDGRATEAVEYIDDKQQGQILDYINEIKGANLDKFLAFMKIATLEEMPKADFQKAVTALEAKRKAQK